MSRKVWVRCGWIFSGSCDLVPGSLREIFCNVDTPWQFLLYMWVGYAVCERCLGLCSAFSEPFQVCSVSSPVHGRIVWAKLLRAASGTSNRISSRDQGCVSSSSPLPPSRQIGRVQGQFGSNGRRHRPIEGGIYHPVLPRISDEIRFRTRSPSPLIVAEPTSLYCLA